MFRIHKETDYALIAVYYIAKEEGFVPLSTIIGKTEMPQRFLARIAARLTNKGVLISKEGRTGGYKLAKKLDEISLLEFLKIFEDELHVLSCEENTYKCKCRDVCHHRSFFSKRLKDMLMDCLEEISLKEVFNSDN